MKTSKRYIVVETFYDRDGPVMRRIISIGSKWGRFYILNRKTAVKIADKIGADVYSIKLVRKARHAKKRK